MFAQNLIFPTKMAYVWHLDVFQYVQILWCLEKRRITCPRCRSKIFRKIPVDNLANPSWQNKVRSCYGCTPRSPVDKMSFPSIFCQLGFFTNLIFVRKIKFLQKNQRGNLILFALQKKCELAPETGGSLACKRVNGICPKKIVPKLSN